MAERIEAEGKVVFHLGNAQLVNGGDVHDGRLDLLHQARDVGRTWEERRRGERRGCAGDGVGRGARRGGQVCLDRRRRVGRLRGAAGRLLLAGRGAKGNQQGQKTKGGKGSAFGPVQIELGAHFPRWNQRRGEFIPGDRSGQGRGRGRGRPSIARNLSPHSFHRLETSLHRRKSRRVGRRTSPPPRWPDRAGPVLRAETT